MCCVVTGELSKIVEYVSRKQKLICVADPDSGSGMEKSSDTESGIEKKWDPGWKEVGSGMEKSRIREKHPDPQKCSEIKIR
jgi:hypothetical protein